MPTKVFTAVLTVLLCWISPALAAEQPVKLGPAD